MKCTDITDFNLCLRKIAVKELEKAIGLLPNKEYKWDDESLPKVCYIDDEILRLQIQRVSYDEVLHIEARDTDSNVQMEVSTDNLSAQDIFHIIEMIHVDEGKAGGEGSNDGVATEGLQRRLELLCGFMKSV